MLLIAMEFGEPAQYWINLILLWIGFGTVVGLISKTILPEGEPKGMFGVLVIGIMGGCVGPLLVTQLKNEGSFQPISPLGATVSILAATVFMLVYRLFVSLTSRHRPKDEHQSTNQGTNQNVSAK